MTPWLHRPREEAHLLNPAFCGGVLAAAATGYQAVISSGMPLPLAPLVLAVTLHQPTRQSLPRTRATSLAVWLQEHASARVLLKERVVSLASFAREAALFGSVYGYLEIGEGACLKAPSAGSPLRRILTDAEPEPKECFKKAEFVGRWFAYAGSAHTVLALWGVRP
jgi:hypothetical protein